MSRWSEQFEKHAIHATLDWLYESASTKQGDLNEDDVSEKRRFLKVLKKYKEILKSIDPELVPFNQLDSLNSALRAANITKQINAYAQNGSIAHLKQASDILSTQLTPLTFLLSLVDKNSYSDSPITELEELVDSATSTLVNKKDSLVAELETLTSSVNEKEKILEEHSKQVKNRLEELSRQIDQKMVETNALVNDWQGQFSTAQDSRSNEFNAWRDKFSTDRNAEVSRVIEGYQEDLVGRTASFNKAVDGILEDGNKKHQAILDLYQLTAGNSVGVGYLKNAQNEQIQADKWRLISVRFIIATVIWLLFSFFYNTNNIGLASTTEVQIDTSAIEANEAKKLSKDAKKLNEEAGGLNASGKLSVVSNPVKTPKAFPWYTLFVTFSMTGVLLWGSAYSAQQSTKHRNNEKKARWFALEVKAFDPFVASLKPDDQLSLKKDLAERLFGQKSTDDDVKITDEHILNLVIDSLRKILPDLKKLWS